MVAGARFCSICGTSQGGAPAQTVTAPVAARRVTSVLFGDLVGFTSLSETRDQEEVRELLSRYFDESRRIIARYGGTVEKFIGDAVMAVWGVPTAHEDDAERAVRAGLELVNTVAAFGQDLGVADLAMRVGIVTGEVAVTIGAEQQGMVAGDAVNTAARVQSAADPGHVWVDETTRLLTSSAITYVDVGSHQMKGKADPVPLWSVRAVVAAMGGAQRADGLEAPLIGRERELRLFKEVFHASEESRRPALLVVDGEPGVGKSRLAWEFEKYVDGLNSVTRWHSGRCVAYGEGVAYYALAEAVRGRLRSLPSSDSDPGDDEPGLLLERGLERYVPDLEERDWLRPRVGALLGVGSVGTFPREDLFAAWATLFERVGENELPVALVIDDAQHADEGLLLFVEHLISVATFGCFVVLLTRPGLLESHPSLATNRRATVIHLPTLAERDMADLLGGLVAGLPDGVRQRLVERSDGIPLFAVETVRSLIDRDLVVPRGGQYVLADPDALDLDAIAAPASLQALIAARLDTLSPEQRRVVDRASVLGSTFPREAIANLCEDIASLDEVLGGLVRIQILSQESGRLSSEYGQYQFVQSVVRQVAYGMLSRRDRKAGHLQVVTLYEANPDGTGEVAAILAQHYLDAIDAMPGDPDVADLASRAIGHLERAARRARSLGSPAEAAGHLLTALEHSADPIARATLESEVAWALVDVGRYDEAIPHAARATEAFDDADDPVAAGRAAAAHGMAMILSGDNAGAAALVEPRWEALADREGADRARLVLGRVITMARTRVGHDARDVQDTRIRLAEKVGDQEELADAITALSVNYGISGSPTLSRVLMEASADIARRQHYPVSLSRTLSNLTVEYTMEDLPRAIGIGREAVEVATRSGVAIWNSYTRVNLLLALWTAGRWDEAVDLMDDHQAANVDINTFVTGAVRGWLSLARDVSWAPDERERSPRDDASDIAWIAFGDAVSSATAGDNRRALSFAAQAVETMHSLSGTWDDFVHMWPPAVRLAILVEDAPQLEGLLRLVDEASARVLIPAAVKTHRQHVAGLVAMRADAPAEEVEGYLRGAIAGFERWGAAPSRARAQADLGVWLVTQARAEEGEIALIAARATFAGLGATAWLEELESRLARVRTLSS